ncbi:hypothetical protein I79_000041 [Cricetulus griseus]|uniref:Uncharacterized protein n=1 Tax=Cricetulus griseus TaxID=10029 RepID=G3GR98_CRIGR|nr:hypothetical protein I79_000041 [Cricetulus griseus]
MPALSLWVHTAAPLSPLLPSPIWPLQTLVPLPSSGVRIFPAVAAAPGEAQGCYLPSTLF